MEKNSRHRGYRALALAAEGDALAMVTLAKLMRGDAMNEEAADLACRALALRPGDAKVRMMARDLLAADVPSWHFWMVRDELRNAAYEAALRRVVTPQTRVLEIGTGSGLLAMMAARAGARHVYTCEEVPQIAQAAREIIARNGYADRISVIGKHSGAVTAAEIGGPADVLVSEIVSNDLLGEGVLPAVEDAKRRLVRQGGDIIPAAGCVRVALAHYGKIERRRMGMVSGFDVSPFNRLARPYHRVRVEDRDLALRSDPATLFRFDFARDACWPPASADVTLEADGEVNSIARWIALDMGGGGLYENRPGTLDMSAWAVLCHPFDQGQHGPSGSWNVRASHEATTIRVWAAPA